MLPLHAQGYRSGFSASPGFRQILQTSSSSSSSSISASYFAAAPNDAVSGDAFSSFSDDVDDVEGDGFMLSAITADAEELDVSPSRGGEGGAAGAISIGRVGSVKLRERGTESGSGEACEILQFSCHRFWR